MVGRLLYFLIVVIVACLLAWAATTIIGAFEFIPAAIKTVVFVVAWALAVIAILVAAYRAFAGYVTVPGPPAP